LFLPAAAWVSNAWDMIKRFLAVLAAALLPVSIAQ